MASFKVDGLEELQQAFTKAGNVPDEVKKEMLVEGGKVLMDSQAKIAREMGIYDQDSESRHAVDSIALTKPKLTEDGGVVSVTFKGKRTDKNHKTPVRNAEIMFINHYGKRGQSPRPFAEVSIAKDSERAVEASQATFDRWQKNNF